MTPTKKLNDKQRQMCECASERMGKAMKGGCKSAKAKQMIAVKYPVLNITPVACCDKCATRIRKSAATYGYTVTANKIVVFPPLLNHS